MNLKTLLQREIKIESVNTYSLHSTKSVMELNSILIEYPMWKKELYVISRLQDLIWVSNFKKTDIEIKEIKESILKKGSSLDKRAEEITENILNLFLLEVEKLNEKEKMTFKAIHIPNSWDISKYVMNSHYRNSIISICSHIYDKLEPYFKELYFLFSKIENEEKVAFHDIEMLFLLHKDSKNVEISELLTKLAQNLKKCPFNGNEMGDILDKVLSGKSEYAIAIELGVSKDYVSKRVKEGKRIMALILWSISSKEFNNLLFD